MSENGDADAPPARVRGQPRVFSAATRARNQALRYYATKEQMEKTHAVLINGIRHKGKTSDNLLLRAMMMDKPIFADGTFDGSLSGSLLAQTSASRFVSDIKPEPVPDLVNGGSGVLLSRGAVPSVVPGKHAFAGVPDSKDWEAAAKRQGELKTALAALESEMHANKTALFGNTKSTFDDPASSGTFVQDPNVATSKNTQVIKGGSNVLGSSFQWRNTQTKSLNVEKFDWPPEYEPRYIGSTKYGALTHELDGPGGNVFINKNAVKKLKGRR